MEITKVITEQVIVNYTVKQDEWTFMDSLTFSKEEYATITEQHVNDLIEARFNEWLSYVQSPTPNNQ